MLSGAGKGKLRLGVLLSDGELGFLIGIKSWRCFREREICRAMEMLAADSRRSSFSESSSRLVLVTAMALGEVCNGKPKADFDTSAGRGRAADTVVALRFGRAAGTVWVVTSLGIAVCGGEDVDVLDAEVDGEWLCESEEAELAFEGGVGCLWGDIICQSGSWNLGLMGNGVGP